MVRAKVSLEGAWVGHSLSCPVDADPDYMGPCSCGASTHNNRVSNALDALKL